MKSYKFKFTDGTVFTGEGPGEAKALYDAYQRNGYLPTTGLESVNPASADPSEIFPDVELLSPEPQDKNNRKARAK